MSDHQSVAKGIADANAFLAKFVKTSAARNNGGDQESPKPKDDQKPNGLPPRKFEF